MLGDPDDRDSSDDEPAPSCASSATACSASPTSTFGGVGPDPLPRSSSDRHPRLDQIYGWETPRRPRPPPCLPPPSTTGIPLSDHIASRAYTTRLQVSRERDRDDHGDADAAPARGRRRPARLAALAPRRDRVRGEGGLGGRGRSRSRSRSRRRTASTRSCTSPATTASQFTRHAVGRDVGRDRARRSRRRQARRSRCPTRRARGSRSATSRSRPRSTQEGFELKAATKKSAFVIADRRGRRVREGVARQEGDARRVRLRR